MPETVDALTRIIKLQERKISHLQYKMHALEHRVRLRQTTIDGMTARFTEQRLQIREAKLLRNRFIKVMHEHGVALEIMGSMVGVSIQRVRQIIVSVENQE